ncbi:hypothetical protein [Aeoliella sp. SH292]|uniref:hypothetical protein n=1 Tax=Aeoliella sp. SH292 TaxID=3454464 RepID=UPI003F948546
MTIAACYVSSEGVVLGADSTTTNFVTTPSKPEGETHRFNYGQKVFEVGEDSSIGIASWGLGSLGAVSIRTLVAQLGDELKHSPLPTMNEVAWRWSTLYWSQYCINLAAERSELFEIKNKGEEATAEEKQRYNDLRFKLSVGFCVGGHTKERRPEAYEIWFRPEEFNPAPPSSILPGYPRFWGWSNLMSRLMYAMDDPLLFAIMNSGKWGGTQDELIQIVLDNRLGQAVDLPLRDAIDWVYSSIYTTIKAIKFSHLEPACGGPIELAVITSDRKFRWVCHKSLDAALDT